MDLHEVSHGMPATVRFGRNLKVGAVAFVLLSAAGLAVVFVVFPTGTGAARAAEQLGVGFALLAVLGTVLDLPLGALLHHISLRRVKPGVSFRLPLKAELATRFSGAVTPSQSGGGPAQLLIF